MQGKQGNLSVVEDGECALVAYLGWGQREVRGGGYEVADWECL